jgi:phage/plasmid-like protein (TIGR03299 family)
MQFAINDSLNWNVVKRPIFFADANGQPTPYDQKVAIVREDTQKPLGIVAPSYEPLQNHSLKQLVAPMVDEGVLTVSNSGTLNGGAKVFLQLAINKEFEVIGESYKGFLTLLNSHNGTTAVAVGPTMVRVICSNTFSCAMTDISERFRHTAGVTERVLNTQAVNTFVDNAMEVYSRNVETLASARCTGSQFKEALEAVYQKPVDKMRDSFVEKLNRLFYSGVGNEGRTMYDAMNAVTEYSSHHAKKTVAGNTYYSQFGAGASINRRAMGVLLEMAAV